MPRKRPKGKPAVDKRRRTPLALKLREFVGDHELAPGEEMPLKNAGHSLGQLFRKDLAKMLLEGKLKTTK